MPNTPPRKPSAPGNHAGDPKKARLAAALRENLKRRKAQTRSRTDDPAGPAPISKGK